MMITHEIVAVRKGHVAGYKVVELQALKEVWAAGDGPHIKGNFQIEVKADELEEIFGPGYDVGDRFELISLQFDSVPNEEEERD